MKESYQPQPDVYRHFERPCISFSFPHQQLVQVHISSSQLAACWKSNNSRTSLNVYLHIQRTRFARIWNMKEEAIALIETPLGKSKKDKKTKKNFFDLPDVRPSKRRQLSICQPLLGRSTTEAPCVLTGLSTQALWSEGVVGFAHIWFRFYTVSILWSVFEKFTIPNNERWFNLTDWWVSKERYCVTLSLSTLGKS